MKSEKRVKSPERLGPLTAWAVLAPALMVVGPLAADRGAPGPTSAFTADQSLASGACAGSPPGCDQGAGSAADLAGGSWSKMRPAPLSPRSFATVVWTGSQLVVWGGATSIGDSQVPVANGAVWDEATGAWHAIAPSPLSPREGAAGVWDGRDVFIWGGDNASEQSSSYRLFANGALYDPETNSWQPLPKSPLSARSRASAIWTGSEVLLVGGGDLTAPAVMPTEEMTAAAFVPSSGRWQSLPQVPSSRG
ncbi:MAG TPA: hypothetical protein VMF65_20780, partial [Acidimicrobiales bacterium]|nr:hypothetical protein [Acidimicrobiales bacterium]